MSSIEPLVTVTRWVGFVSGVLTIILWCFQLSSTSASISIGSDPLADVNKATWRMQLFSFVPSVFIDVWTPFVMGAMTLMSHFASFHLDYLTVNFAHYFIWSMLMALFGNIGYAGVVGIVVASVTLLAALLSLICVVMYKGTASLKLGS
ncbi:uncharacterized protein LOC34620838 [Cyclospora cayetanensis]|uniref:Uncharacterized protein n=2 Tax=Cyclospora cayetanensis TaxID=88456 RepID=A0A1D3D3F3_9EIME|nr:uncharacterized protein LOC34620838 [Cyclospora cayetanensis]OEH77970.1 hypothetical protein cyc_04288 [Cyclospora cayetanensis]